MTSPGHSPGTAWQARGKQGPTAATRGLHALGQAAPLASQPAVMPREEARCRSPGPRTPSSLQSEGRPEQGVESDGGPLPRSGASLVSGGHVSRPPRPRANRWGEGARPLLPGTAPHPGVKTGVRGPIVETVVPVDCTPTHCAAPPDPGASAPHLEGGARTSWGSPLPSPVSRPPPPGGRPPGSCPRLGFVTASHHLESWVTNTAQATGQPAAPHSRVCSRWRSGGPPQGGRGLLDTVLLPRSPQVTCEPGKIQ